MMITDAPAQMVVSGAETGHWRYAWLLQNDDPSVEIYVDIHPNIFNEPGSPNFVLGPGGSQLAVTGEHTYWARTAQGQMAELRITPTATFATTGTFAASGGGGFR